MKLLRPPPKKHSKARLRKNGTIELAPKSVEEVSDVVEDFSDHGTNRNIDIGFDRRLEHDMESYLAQEGTDRKLTSNFNLSQMHLNPYQRRD